MSYLRTPLDTSPQGMLALRPLLQHVFPGAPKFTPEYLDWLYVRNPAGAAVGCNAFANGELVAHYATIPIEAEVEGRAERGLLSLNTATHPDHQGKGLFTRLANETYEHAAQLGFSFVVGVANANSTPGFTRKLGFTLVSPLEARVGLGTTDTVARAAPQCFARRWNPASLRWRLSDPTQSYTRRRSASGEYDQVLAASGFPLIRAALARVPRNAETAPILDQLPCATWQPWVFIGLDPELTWKRSLSVPVPQRLRPSPLNLIFRSLSQRLVKLDAARVKFEAIDFDAY
jgi:GNAT superfamily N-acetyltransferase